MSERNRITDKQRKKYHEIDFFWRTQMPCVICQKCSCEICHPNGPCIPILVKVYVDFNGTIHSTEISSETHTFLKDQASLKNLPIQFFLFHAVKEYGPLTEESILKFMNEKIKN